MNFFVALALIAAAYALGAMVQARDRPQRRKFTAVSHRRLADRGVIIQLWEGQLRVSPPANVLVSAYSVEGGEICLRLTDAHGKPL